ELQGGRKACGVDAVLEGQTGVFSLRDLLETYEASGDSPAETAQQKLERRLDVARREIAALGFEAKVVATQGEEETYSLLVRAIAKEKVECLRGVKASLWPITLGSESSKPLGAVFGKGISFSPVSF